ncbi:tesmin isoform X4 [Pseudophryne corroboree]|uniref:tesmin isoform X4 n=1 Tax=Pseudophryne corroboree TaxID=495146 RepID=UPI0030813FC5
MDFPEFNCELDHVQSSLYNVNMYNTAITQSNRASTLLETSYSQSGKSQHDATVFTDLRPYTAHYSDITCPDANYIPPCMGLPKCCDESCQASYRSSAAEYDLRPYTAHYSDIITCPDVNYIQSHMGLPKLPNYSDESCQASYRSAEYPQLRTAGASITDGGYERHYFQNENSSRPMPALMEDLPCVQQSDCSSMVICQNGNNRILYMNNPDTGEIKTYHLLSHPEEQFRYNFLNSDRSENITRYPGCEQTFQYPVFQYSTDTPNPSPMLRSMLPVAPTPHISINNMANRSVYALTDDEIYHPQSNMQGTANVTITDIPVSMLDNNKSTRPCSCTKSQCLKLYCDCFANGEFCSNCNCNNCYNNIYHQHERIQAIKGKIMCSSICKCMDCKNCEEGPERKSVRNMQQDRDAGSIVRICTSMEVVRATCACLLAQAEEAEKQGYSVCLAQQKVIEEFGKCLTQILHTVVPGETCS